MAEVAITFRCTPQLHGELSEEMTRSGFKSLNKYVPAFLQDTRVVAIRTGKDPVLVGNPSAGLQSQIDQLKKEKSDLQAQVEQLKKAPVKTVTETKTDDKLLEHVIARAWEISRISREQLVKGYDSKQ